MELVYQAGTAPEIAANQSVNSKNFATSIANTFGKSEFLLVYGDVVQKIAASAMAKEKPLDDIIWENILILNQACVSKLGIIPGNVVMLGLDYMLIKDGITCAHYPELCMAWMDSISEEVLTKQKSFWKVFVNCPVDIYVYESENLVGCIKNDVPQQIENGVIPLSAYENIYV